MGEPHAILLVPTDGDPGGLLAVRRLPIPPTGGAHPLFATSHGAHPPQVVWWREGRRNALAVWWDGALVPQGWDQARRVAFDAAGFTGGPELSAALDSVEVMHPGPAAVLRLARALEAAGLCRVVVLDLVDGAVVERAP